MKLVVLLLMSLVYLSESYAADTFECRVSKNFFQNPEGPKPSPVDVPVLILSQLHPPSAFVLSGFDGNETSFRFDFRDGTYELLLSHLPSGLFYKSSNSGIFDPWNDKISFFISLGKEDDLEKTFGFTVTCGPN